MYRKGAFALVSVLLAGLLVCVARAYGQDTYNQSESTAIEPISAEDETFPPPAGSVSTPPGTAPQRRPGSGGMMGQRRPFGQGQPGGFGQGRPLGPGTPPGAPRGSLGRLGGPAEQGRPGLRHGALGGRPQRLRLAWDQIRKVMAVIARVEPERARELMGLRERFPEEFRARLAELSEEIFHKYEGKVLEYVNGFEPEAADMLELVKESDERRYQFEILSRVDRALELETLKENDPDHYDLLVKERDLTKESFELARAYNEAADDAEREEAHAALRNILGELFDVRMRLKQKEVERIEKDIAKLKKQIASRRENRDKIIELRALEMTRPADVAW